MLYSHIYFSHLTFTSLTFINAPQKITNKNMNLSRYKQKYWIILKLVDFLTHS